MAAAVLLAGPAGSGKTSAARFIARSHQAVVLHKDCLTEPLAGPLLEALGQPAWDRESFEYVETVRPLEYAVITQALLSCLRSGQKVVVDAPFVAQLLDPLWVSELRHQVEDLTGEKLRIVWLRCSPTALKARLELRNEQRDQGKLADWAHYKKQLESPPPGADLVLDSEALMPEEVADEVLRLLGHQTTHQQHEVRGLSAQHSGLLGF